MTPTDRFTLTLLIITLLWGSLAAAIGWTWKRRVNKDDEWRQHVDERFEHLADVSFKVRAYPDNITRLERALEKLAEIVTRQGEQMAHFEGQQEQQARRLQ